MSRILIVLFVCVFWFGFVTTTVNAQTVCPAGGGCDYTTISAAVSAMTGGTITASGAVGSSVTIPAGESYTITGGILSSSLVMYSTGNHIIGMTIGGVMQDRGGNSIFEGNTIAGTFSMLNGGSSEIFGNYCEGNTYLSSDNNDFYNNYLYFGFRINNHSTGNHVYNNYRTGGSYYIGLFIQDGAHDNIVEDNDFSGTGGFGLSIHTSDNNIVRYNNFSMSEELVDYYYRGLYNSNNNIIVGNDFSNSVTLGFLITNSDYNLFEYNDFSSNPDYGISNAAASVGNEFGYNNFSNGYDGFLDCNGCLNTSFHNNLLLDNTHFSIDTDGEYGIYHTNVIVTNATALNINGGTYNTFYDNFIKARVNATLSGTNTGLTFNTTNTTGLNILGFHNIGGNYWGNYSGLGYSDTCADVDGNAFCDVPFNASVTYRDFLPLSLNGTNFTPIPPDTLEVVTMQWYSDVAKTIPISSGVFNRTYYMGFVHANGDYSNYDYNVSFYLPNGTLWRNISVQGIETGTITWFIGSYASDWVGTWRQDFTKHNTTSTRILNTTTLTLGNASTVLNASLSGYVRDTSANLLNGVNLIAVKNYTLVAGPTSLGYYIFPAMLNGTYNVTASKTGYNSSTRSVTMNGSNKYNFNFILNCTAACPTATPTSTPTETPIGPTPTAPVPPSSAELSSWFWTDLFIWFMVMLVFFIISFGDRK